MSGGMASRTFGRSLGSGVVPATPAAGYPLTVADYPSLLHGFVRAGVGATTIVDHRGEVALNCASGYVVGDPTPESFYNNGTQTVAGAYRAIGTLNALCILTGGIASATQLTRLGDITAGTGIRLQSNGSNIWRRAASNAATGVTLGGSPSFPLTAIASILDQTSANGTCRLFGRNATTSYGPTSQTVTGDISDNWAAFVAQIQMTFDSYTGIYLFAMGWLPSDAFIAAALVWMATPGHEGVPYPGFYHR